MTIRFDIDLGVNTLKGVLTLRDNDLLIEWRRYNVMDAPLDSLDSAAIPYTDLTSASIRRKIRRPIIEIRAKSASTFGEMPLPAGDLALFRAKTTRADRELAPAWGAEAGLRIADAIDGGTLLE